MKRKLLTILMALALVFTMMPVTVLAEEEHIIKLEFGAGHEDFVKRFFDAEINLYDSIYISQAEEGATYVFVNMKRDKAGMAREDLEDALNNRIFTDSANRTDGEFRLMQNLGLKASYDSWDEWRAEDEALQRMDYEEVETFYALWEKPAKLDLTVTQPQCGITVKVEGNGAETHTVPAVEVTADDVECVQNQANWFSGVDFISFFRGPFEGGKDYYGTFQLKPKFGYYIPKDAFNNITISGATIISGINSDWPYFRIKTTAVHIEDDPHVVDPTCTEPGSKTYTCPGCRNEIEESIDALGHDWGKWTKLNDKQHQRVCANDSSHVEKADHKWNDDGTIYTCADCGATKKKETSVSSGTLMAKMTANGKTGLTIDWNKVNGAAGYDIFFARCNHGDKITDCKLVKTMEGNDTLSWTKTSLKKRRAYKAYVKAFVMQDGKKKYVSTSPMIHAYTGNSTKNYTNARSVSVNKTKVSLKKGKTFRIKAKVSRVKTNKKLMPKSHVATLRYKTSDSKVATVSKTGKITAKGKGACYVYAYAHNGVCKKIKVTVN